jgi:hypothetical protein
MCNWPTDIVLSCLSLSASVTRQFCSCISTRHWALAVVISRWHLYVITLKNSPHLLRRSSCKLQLSVSTHGATFIIDQKFTTLGLISMFCLCYTNITVSCTCTCIYTCTYNPTVLWDTLKNSLIFSRKLRRRRNTYRPKNYHIHQTVGVVVTLQICVTKERVSNGSRSNGYPEFLR